MTSKEVEKKQSPSGSKEATPKKRKLGKTLKAFTPFIKWHVGLIVCGRIERKFSNASTYGEKNNIEIRLVDPIEYTDAEGEVIALAPDDTVNVGQVAGLNNALTLPVGTLCQIECLGKKELGKGRQPAWEFEVTYE